MNQKRNQNKKKEWLILPPDPSGTPLDRCAPQNSADHTNCHRNMGLLGMFCDLFFSFLLLAFPIHMPCGAISEIHPLDRSNNSLVWDPKQKMQGLRRMYCNFIPYTTHRILHTTGSSRSILQSWLHGSSYKA